MENVEGVKGAPKEEITHVCKICGQGATANQAKEWCPRCNRSLTFELKKK